MYNILRASTSGMIANQEKINIASNNIVNSQTTGYKKLDVGFLDLYTKSLESNYNPHSSNGSLTGTGTKIAEATRNMVQGPLKNTGIDTNLAIDGEGYFCLIRPDGSHCLTRNGDFSLDANGTLVDANGNRVDITYANGYNRGNVDLSDGKLNINKEGQIYLDDKMVGRINLYVTEGTNDLISVGDSLFALKEGANMYAYNEADIRQGHVEMSNVNLSSEMTDLITVQRAFQFNSKGIKAVDEMWSMINNLQSR